MLLRRLHISGYRSLRDVDWRPGALNVLIGPNGSGKSNILRILRLLRSSAEGHLSDALASEGGIQQVLWDGQSPSIGIQLETERLEGVGEFQYELDIASISYLTQYRIQREFLTCRADDSPSGSEPYTCFLKSGNEIRVLDATTRQLVVPKTVESVPAAQGLIDQARSQNAETESVLSRFESFSNAIEPWIFALTLQWIDVLADVRTDIGAEIRQPPVTKYEQRLSRDGQNLVSVLHTLYTSDRNFERAIDDAMRAAFGDDYEKLVFPPAADQRIQFRIRWRSLKREQSLADISDGTLRFLLLITMLCNPHSGRVLAIDEPETGLHPAMLPIVAEYAREASRQKQIVFTSHSAQFLSAFGTDAPTTTVVLREKGATKLQNWSDKKLAKWLESYTLGQLFESGELESAL